MVKTAIIENYLNEKFNNTKFSIQPIVGLGEVNQVFKVVVHDNTYILRVNEESEFDTFVKEHWCYVQSHKHGVPVPQGIDVVTKDRASLFLMEFIDGENCSNFKDQEFITSVYKQLGNYVKRISEIKPKENVGNLNSVENAKKWFYEDYLGYEIKQTSDTNDYLDLSKKQRSSILKMLGLLRNTEFEFVLCHGDISTKNCMYVEQTKTIYLIDFGNAETQVKDYFEIANKRKDLKCDKTISDSDFSIFASEVLGKDATSWIAENERLLNAFSIVYRLDKYRWARDRNPKLEADYKENLYKVLNTLL